MTGSGWVERSVRGHAYREDICSHLDVQKPLGVELSSDDEREARLMASQSASGW